MDNEYAILHEIEDLKKLGRNLDETLNVYADYLEEGGNVLASRIARQLSLTKRGRSTIVYDAARACWWISYAGYIELKAIAYANHQPLKDLSVTTFNKYTGGINTDYPSWKSCFDELVHMVDSLEKGVPLKEIEPKGSRSYFRSVSLRGRKSCPTCKVKFKVGDMVRGNSIWSWGIYHTTKWRTMTHFCENCFEQNVLIPLSYEQDSLKIFVPYQGEVLPAWLTYHRKDVEEMERKRVQFHKRGPIRSDS